MATDTNREIADGVLSVRVSENGTRCILALAGELDLANAATAETELDAAMAKDADVVVDMSRLEFIDSTGIALLVKAMSRNSDAAKLSFVPSQFPGVAKVLELTGVAERMTTVVIPAADELRTA